MERTCFYCYKTIQDEQLNTAFHIGKVVLTRHNDCPNIQDLKLVTEKLLKVGYMPASLPRSLPKPKENMSNHFEFDSNLKSDSLINPMAFLKEFAQFGVLPNESNEVSNTTKIEQAYIDLKALLMERKKLRGY